MVDRLRAQACDERLSVMVVDDGSTDGTEEYLKLQHDVAVVSGDGTLWWGGAVHVALNKLFLEASDQDWLLLINNDSDIDDDFVQKLLDTARAHRPAAVGSVLHHIDHRERLLSVGPKLNAWSFLIEDAIHGVNSFDGNDNPDLRTLDVDALSGRGVLYSLEVLREVGGMRPRCLPHYLADYELSARVKAAGHRLLVSMDAITYTDEDFGNAYKASSLREKLLSVRSPSYLPAVVAFWWRASSTLQALTAPFRLLGLALAPQLRRRKRHVGALSNE